MLTEKRKVEQAQGERSIGGTYTAAIQDNGNGGEYRAALGHAGRRTCVRQFLHPLRPERLRTHGKRESALREAPNGKSRSRSGATSSRDETEIARPTTEGSLKGRERPGERHTRDGRLKVIGYWTAVLWIVASPRLSPKTLTFIGPPADRVRRRAVKCRWNSDGMLPDAVSRSRRAR